MRKALMMFAFLPVLSFADIVNFDSKVLGGGTAFEGFAEGVVSNVANAKESSAFISCETRAELLDIAAGSNAQEFALGTCKARISGSAQDVACITTNPGLLKTIQSIGDSSKIYFDYFLGVCKSITVTNGSVNGAKVAFKR